MRLSTHGLRRGWGKARWAACGQEMTGQGEASGRQSVVAPGIEWEAMSSHHGRLEEAAETSSLESCFC